MKSNPDKYIILSNSVIAHLYGYVIVALLTKQKQTKWDMFKNNLWCEQSSFEELLEKDSPVSAHKRNIQILASS